RGRMATPFHGGDFCHVRAAQHGSNGLLVRTPLMRALIADDDRVATAILQRALQRSNLDVTVVHDRGDAWHVLNSNDPPSIALLDWMMPTMDGVEVCRRVREECERMNPYLMLLTARDSRSDVVAGFDAGADDYLIKPFDADELQARVRVGI